MDNKRLNIGNICKQREDLQRVNELPSLLLAALDIECEYRAAAVFEVSAVKLVLRMIGQGRVVDLFYQRMCREELNDLLGVFSVAFKAQRKCLYALQEQECVER